MFFSFLRASGRWEGQEAIVLTEHILDLKLLTMKNLMLLSLFLLFLAQTATGQHRRGVAHHWDINAGIGVLPTYVKDAGKMVAPPLSLSADYRLSRNFSLGAFAGYSITETGLRTMRDGGLAEWSNRTTLAGLRAAARSSQRGPWTIYGGVTLAYAHANIDIMEGQLEKVKEEKGIRESSGRMVYGGFFGSRYSLTPQFGVFGEIGFGISLASVGLSVRL